MLNIRRVLRGEVYYTNLAPAQGSEQSGLRPCVIIQNDIGNAHSTTTIIAPITSAGKPKLPTHYEIKQNEKLRGLVLCEQIRVVDKARLKGRICSFTAEQMKEIDICIKASLGL